MTTLHACEQEARLAVLARPAGGGPLAGRIHSLFHTALNLVADDTLICVLSAGRSLHPHSLVLAETIDFEALDLAPGQPATLAAEALTLGGAAGAPALTVDLSGAAPQDLSLSGLASRTPLTPPADWEGCLATLAAEIAASPGAADGLAPALRYLAPGRFPALPSNRWCSFLLPRLQALPALLLHGSADEIAAAGRRLAGCGPGLTPASDDLLVGLMAGILAADKAGVWPGPNAAAACRALAAGAQAATGTIPAAYLASAGQGHFSRDTLTLLAALFSPAGPHDVAAEAARVAQFGASSGSDLLAGLWLALAVAAPLS